jgi:hypothetical protein
LVNKRASSYTTPTSQNELWAIEEIVVDEWSETVDIKEMWKRKRPDIFAEPFPYQTRSGLSIT